MKVGAIVLLALVITALAFRYSGRKRSEQTSAPVSPGLANRTLLTPPMPFGYKTAWLAIRSDDVQAVAGALELQNQAPANWEYGIWHSVNTDDYSIFITPPIKGWILAVGVPILYESDNHATKRITDLSRQFGEVQLFASMRVSSAYLWARARNGMLQRRFYEADGDRRETGEPIEERALGLKFFDDSSPQAKEPGYWERKDLTYPDEEDVLKVAGMWSIDPSKLEDMGLAPALGVLGQPSSSYPAKPAPVRKAIGD